MLAQDIKVESIFCRGVYSTQNSLKYAEWNIIKRISNFKVIFKLDDDSRTAKFKVRKGNAGIIVGTGGWERETGEKTSLNMFFSQIISQLGICTNQNILFIFQEKMTFPFCV